MLALGYPYLSAGINNQKLAFAGLIGMILKKERPLILPHILDFTPGASGQRALPFTDFFDATFWKPMLEKLGVQLAIQSENTGYETISANDCFYAGADYMQSLADKTLTSEENWFLQCLSGLQAVPTIKEKAAQILAQVKKEGIELACQLRIEKDWQSYSSNVLSRRLNNSEDYNLCFNRVIEKIQQTSDLSNKDAVFICCDEENLPVSKEEIKSYCADNFGKTLFFKSDFMPLEAIANSRTGRSMVDFEVCSGLSFFVGLTRSTFSNVLCLTSTLARTQQRHFIYNAPSSSCLERYDHGTSIDPFAAANEKHCDIKIAIA